LSLEYEPSLELLPYCVGLTDEGLGFRVRG